MNTNDPIGVLNEVDVTLKEFATCGEIMTSDMIMKLPLELQIKLMNAYVDLTAALNKFNSEAKQIIVMASVLSRV